MQPIYTLIFRIDNAEKLTCLHFNSRKQLTKHLLTHLFELRGEYLDDIQISYETPNYLLEVTDLHTNPPTYKMDIISGFMSGDGYERKLVIPRHELHAKLLKELDHKLGEPFANMASDESLLTVHLAYYPMDEPIEVVGEYYTWQIFCQNVGGGDLCFAGKSEGFASAPPWG